MSLSPLEMIGEIAGALADSDGPRQGCERIAAPIARAIRARLAFVALASDDDSVADLLAAHGLGAADFRRLESRLTRSRLWAVLKLAEPVAIDDASTERALECLAFGGGSRFIVAVPILLHGKPAGLVAGGFASASGVDEDAVVRVLQVIAALIAQEVRVHELRNAEAQRLEDENLQLSHALRERYDFGQLIGNSGPMRHVFSLVTQVARANSSVLLRGEPGTGKELIANAIHYNSLRRKRPFVAVNCGGLPEGSADNELFGERPGSKRKGRIESAHGGTLFLNEVHDLPLGSQRRLADALENPRGDGASVFNVRLVASTSRDLEAAIDEGEFDRSLFDILRPFSIFLPPLRERKSDILMLAEHFLERFALEHKKHILRISTPAIDMLTAYHFPGNVGELANAMERAVIDCDSNVIHGHHLPPTLQTAEMSGTETRLTLTAAVQAFERDLIQDALKSTRGNVAKAARMLDSTERILGYKIRKYGISPTRFRRWKATTH